MTRSPLIPFLILFAFGCAWQSAAEPRPSAPVLSTEGVTVNDRGTAALPARPNVPPLVVFHEPKDRGAAGTGWERVDPPKGINEPWEAAAVCANLSFRNAAAGQEAHFAACAPRAGDTLETGSLTRWARGEMAEFHNRSEVSDDGVGENGDILTSCVIEGQSLQLREWDCGDEHSSACAAVLLVVADPDASLPGAEVMHLLRTLVDITPDHR